MYRLHQQLEAQMHAQIRQDQANDAAAKAAEQRRQADIAVAEANRLAAEAALAAQEAERQRLALEETRRTNELVINATQEANGLMDGISNMQAVFNEAPDVVANFLASKPLEGAIVSNNLDAVMLLVDKGERYDAWRDIVDEGTSLHRFLSEKFKISSLKLNRG